MSVAIICEVRASNEKDSFSLRTFSGFPVCSADAMAPPSAMHIRRVTESFTKQTVDTLSQLSNNCPYTN